MKKRRWFILVSLMLTVFYLSQAVFAQITIKIPKINQPKTTPTPISAPTNPTQKNPAQTPVATENPVLLKTTLDIRCDTLAKYWKLPNESNYTSWIPQVKFKVFYGGATKLRLMAEYFTPDGKPWYSETLTQNMIDGKEQTVEQISERTSNKHDQKSVITTGTFGVKITDTRDGSVLFQGKFNVGKFKYGPNIPMFKNQHDFFVEQDWNLPFGYVWLNPAQERNAPLPTVSLWIKGETRLDDLEARLFQNGQQIFTTDDMGEKMTIQQRYPNSLENKETHRWELYNFAWYKFRYAATAQGRKMFPKAQFMNDLSGDFTVKIFHKSVQIREVQFSIANGSFVDNNIAKSNNFAENKVIVPVKIMGEKDKWNQTQWKTGAFYGNPLTGFNWQ